MFPSLTDFFQKLDINFVDGKRSYYDIYKAVRAEAMAAGSWYYGQVTLDDIVGLLDAAEAAGAIQLLNR